MDVTAVGSEEFLLLGEVFAVGSDDTARVEHEHVLTLCAERDIELRTHDGGSSGTAYDNLNVLNLLSCHFEGIDEAGAGDDGRAVLVVVHDGDVEALLQTVLNIKALRGLYVLKVNAAKRWSNLLYGFAKLLGVLLCYLYIEHVYAAVYLEQKSFTLHHRLAGHGTNVAKSQHGSTV